MTIPELEELVFDDHMGATRTGFQLTYSSLWHLATGGTRLIVRPSIIIPRTILWLDVSKWQGEIDFVVMKNSGVHGVVIKCGQGTAKDPKFDVNWAGAKAAGIPRGSYWFFDSRVPPKQQALNWWTWIQHDKGELMHFADYEENYGGQWGGWQNFKIFLQEFQRLSQLPDSRIGIYTGYFYWIAHSPTSALELAYFARFELWLAWYTDDPSDVVIPRPWLIVIFIAWQYGTPPNGKMRGCDSIEVDENNVNCVDQEAYANRFGFGDTIPPPPNGDTMYIEVKSTESSEKRSIRNGHSIKNTKIGDLPVNGIAKSHGRPEDIFTYPADVPDSTQPSGFSARAGDQWIRIYEVNGAPVSAVESWLAVIHLRVIYTVLRVVGEPTTPSPDMPVRIELGDDITYVKQVITTVMKPKV